MDSALKAPAGGLSVSNTREGSVEASGHHLPEVSAEHIAVGGTTAPGASNALHIQPTQVILIFLGYPGSSQELESARGTLRLTLRGLRYIPGDRSVTIISDIDIIFPDDKGQKLRTIEPTLPNIRQALQTVLGGLAAKGRATVIICGHGKKDRESGAYYLDLPNDHQLSKSELSKILQESIKQDTEVLVVVEPCLGAHLIDLRIEYEAKNGKFTLLKNEGTDTRIKGTLIVLAGTLAQAQTIQTKGKKTIYTLMSHTMWRYSRDKSVTDNLAALLIYIHKEFEASLKAKLVELPQVPRLLSSRLLPETISIGAFRIFRAPS